MNTPIYRFHFADLADAPSPVRIVLPHAGEAEIRLTAADHELAYRQRSHLPALLRVADRPGQ